MFCIIIDEAMRQKKEKEHRSLFSYCACEGYHNIDSKERVILALKHVKLLILYLNMDKIIRNKVMLKQETTYLPLTSFDFFFILHLMIQIISDIYVKHCNKKR